MLYPTLDDSDGLGRNIAYAQQARQQRFADYANAISRGATPNIGGPLPDPSWDAFFGAMNDAQDRANAAGYRFRAKFPSLAGLHDAVHGVSPLDSQYTENPLNPLNSQYDLNTQAAMAGRRQTGS